MTKDSNMEDLLSMFHDEPMKELSISELSVLCSNLAHGFEKQYLNEEADSFAQLAEYFQAVSPLEKEDTTEAILETAQKELETGYSYARQTANAAQNQGALKALDHSEKATDLLSSLLMRYNNEGDAFLENCNVYVCTSCGSIHIGDNIPEKCPVCNASGHDFEEIQRRQVG